MHTAHLSVLSLPFLFNLSDRFINANRHLLCGCSGVAVLWCIVLLCVVYVYCVFLVWLCYCHVLHVLQLKAAQEETAKLRLQITELSTLNSKREQSMKVCALPVSDGSVCVCVRVYKRKRVCTRAWGNCLFTLSTPLYVRIPHSYVITCPYMLSHTHTRTHRVWNSSCRRKRGR